MVFSAFPAPESKPRFTHPIIMNAVNLNAGGDLPARAGTKDRYYAHRESLSPPNDWTKNTSLLVECVVPIAGSYNAVLLGDNSCAPFMTAVRSTWRAICSGFMPLSG